MLLEIGFQKSSSIPYETHSKTVGLGSNNRCEIQRSFETHALLPGNLATRDNFLVNVEPTSD
jgi:hypothetical protein